jgi:hypothetical protein
MPETKANMGKVTREEGSDKIGMLASGCRVGVPGTGNGDPLALKNARRVFLIHRKSSQGLTPAEVVELEQLQAEMDRYVDEIAPVSFEVLETFEEHARRIGITVPEKEDSDPGRRED